MKNTAQLHCYKMPVPIHLFVGLPSSMSLCAFRDGLLHFCEVTESALSVDD